MNALKGLVEWWSKQDGMWRYGVPLLFIIVSTGMLIGGRIWLPGWGIGLVLLLFAGPSKAGLF